MSSQIPALMLLQQQTTMDVLERFTPSTIGTALVILILTWFVNRFAVRLLNTIG